MHDLAPTTQVSRWLAALDAALLQEDVAAATGLFAAECYWRDLVAFTWNIVTVEGRDGIAAMLAATLAACPADGLGGSTARPTAADGLTEGWFTFETAVARGKGHVRLAGDRCFTLLTTITELKGHEERRGETRELGVEPGAVRNRKSWLDRKLANEAALGDPCSPIASSSAAARAASRLARG